MAVRALSTQVNDVRKEDLMRKLLFATAATMALMAAVPASAQVYVGADPYGAGVRVGPLGFGVGPRYGWRDHWRRDYAYGCRVIRERTVTPSGRVIFETHSTC
jgi:hypothetical protein